MGKPRLDFDPVLGQMCVSPWRPIKLTGLLVVWLRQHFGDPANIVTPTLAPMVWSPAASSPILIDAGTRWNPQVTGKRPGIYVRRGNIEPRKDVIDHRVQNVAAADAGRLIYYQHFEGESQVLVVGGEGGEGEVLAGEVYPVIMAFSRVVRSQLDFKLFELGSISENKKLEEAQEAYAVTITVKYVYGEAWELVNESAAALTGLAQTITASPAAGP